MSRLLLLLIGTALSSLAVPTALRSSDELITSCYEFPEKDFGKANNVRSTYGSSPKLMLDVGDVAVNFTLRSVYNEVVNLGSLLEKRAVVLIWGHWTCPAFQGFHSDTTFMGASYDEENTMADQYGDYITVVHLIGPEPHPIWPFTNFDSGALKLNMWSTIK
jgi:hypothetical protein